MPAPPAQGSTWLHDVMRSLDDEDLQKVVDQCQRTDGSAEAKLAYIIMLVLRSVALEVLSE